MPAPTAVFHKNGALFGLSAAEATQLTTSQPSDYSLTPFAGVALKPDGVRLGKVMIFHSVGKVAELSPLEAKQTVERRPTEWSLNPWSGVPPILPHRNKVTGEPYYDL